MATASIEQQLRRAEKLYAAGRFADSEKSVREVLNIVPRHPGALSIQALIAYQTGHSDVSVRLLRQAIEVFPNNADYWANLGMVLASLQRMEEAIQSLLKALVVDPKHVDARNHLGNVYAIQGKYEQAIAEYRQVLGINPKLPMTWDNAGQVLLFLNDAAGAIKAFESAINLDLKIPGYYVHLASAYKMLSKRDAAIESLRSGIRVGAVSPELFCDLGTFLIDQTQYAEAERCYRDALGLQPTYLPALINLGSLLRSLSRLTEAEQVLKSAVQIDPQSLAALNNLANVLRELNRLDEAEALLQQIVKADPSLIQAANNLGAVLKNRGRVDGAISVFQALVQRAPTFHDGWSNLLYAIHFDPCYDAAEILAHHLRWRQMVAEPLMGRVKPLANDGDPDRRLRIGYVSPDFRDHVVGRNLIPLFQNHRHDQFEIICYSDVRKTDALTNRFRTMADLFRDVAGQTNSAVADLVREDQIDILVDLTLHMDRNRLLVFAEKPAPVQITFAGYPSTTGLHSIDYRLTDSLLDPPGIDETVYAEALLRLPGSFWCFDPIESTPEVNPLPALTNGFMTFGCLNNFSKVNDQVLSLWGKALRDTPGSRMIILCDSPKASAHALQVLENVAGQSLASRVSFVGKRPRFEYLALFNQIDLALDTFPYNGHTTTLDGLWMGAPVVSVRGRTSVGRAGAAQLTLVGLDRFVAENETAFLSLIQDVSSNLNDLAGIRRGLRQRMQRSVLMDSRRFAHDVEAAYRQAWHKYCASV